MFNSFVFWNFVNTYEIDHKLIFRFLNHNFIRRSLWNLERHREFIDWINKSFFNTITISSLHLQFALEVIDSCSNSDINK